MTKPTYTHAVQEFLRLLTIMDTLRSPGGCPWDGEQTHESLVKYLIEESYEVVEAIESPTGVNRELLKEELGDVLLQVVFHARVAEEADDQAFGIEEVLQALNHKLETRHPHVFAEKTNASTARDVEAAWEELKKKEKPERTFAFDGIPPQLPALALAEKTFSKAQKNGVNIEELEQQYTGEEAELLLGKQLFSLVKEAKSQGLDPERALRRYTRMLISNHRVEEL